MADYRVALDDMLQSNLSELFYQSLGSTPLSDTLYMFVISPLAFVAFVMNMVSFVLIIGSDELKCNLIYKYLVLYAFNNSVFCLLISASFCTLAFRYFPWSFSLFSRVHRCYILNFVVISFVIVNKVLEILIICHRLSLFKAMFRKVNTAHLRHPLCRMLSPQSALYSHDQKRLTTRHRLNELHRHRAGYILRKNVHVQLSCWQHDQVCGFVLQGNCSALRRGHTERHVGCLLQAILSHQNASIHRTFVAARKLEQKL